MTYKGLHKIISGGQTGADQGGLLAGYRAGLETGGTAPSNFHTEIGKNPLLECLGLKAEGDYRSRTIKNVKDSDGTLLITLTPDSPGSRLTRNQAMQAEGKSFLQIDLVPIENAWVGLLLQQVTPEEFRAILAEPCGTICQWLIDNNVGVLNVAGNREKGLGTSTCRSVCATLIRVFELLRVDGLLIQKM